jgi:hypothetical protein
MTGTRIFERKYPKRHSQMMIFPNVLQCHGQGNVTGGQRCRNQQPFHIYQTWPITSIDSRPSITPFFRARDPRAQVTCGAFAERRLVNLYLKRSSVLHCISGSVRAKGHEIGWNCRQIWQFLPASLTWMCSLSQYIPVKGQSSDYIHRTI